jgi:hypothetical protein
MYCKQTFKGRWRDGDLRPLTDEAIKAIRTRFPRRSRFDIVAKRRDFDFSH